MTSHDVVDCVRRLFGQRKVGHAGTLDPMATGVLLLCLGQATRVAEYLMRGRKTYRGTVWLGVTTDTYDAEGTVTHSMPSFTVSLDQIRHALTAAQGITQQIPPPFSAVRHNGQRLYCLARQGIQVQAKPRPIEIEGIRLIAWESPRLSLEVTCSPGTYIRSLAHDLGQELGVGGHLSALTRLASGHWKIGDSVSLDHLQTAVEADDWQRLLHPMDAALQDFERVDLSLEMVPLVTHGQSVPLDRAPQTDIARAYTPDGALLALLQPSDQPGCWRPKKVFQIRQI
jgi:tRNA pseudouridine55 synthase